jgi:hypothetical protein
MRTTTGNSKNGKAFLMSGGNTNDSDARYSADATLPFTGSSDLSGAR